MNVNSDWHSDWKYEILHRQTIGSSIVPKDRCYTYEIQHREDLTWSRAVYTTMNLNTQTDGNMYPHSATFSERANNSKASWSMYINIDPF